MEIVHRRRSISAAGHFQLCSEIEVIGRTLSGPITGIEDRRA
jgi:hypothetical protein